MTMFGRDSIFTSLQALPFTPELAATTLRVLGDWQGSRVDDFRDEDPGRILHEMRYGEMAAFEERPHSPYYGSADATPLYVVLLDEYERWTGDRELVRELEFEARAALKWIDEYADLMGNGYISYKRRNEKTGLENQCWKDSWNSISLRDGRLPGFPRATCELQGTPTTRRSAARGWPASSGRTRPSPTGSKRRPPTSSAASTATSGWRTASYYALALDADGSQVDSLASNIGHLLWSGIVDARQGQGRRRAPHGPAALLRLGRPDAGRGRGPLQPRSATTSGRSGRSTTRSSPGGCGGTASRRRPRGSRPGSSTPPEFFEGRLPEAFGGYDRDADQVPGPVPDGLQPAGLVDRGAAAAAADDARARADRRPPDRRPGAAGRHRPPRAARHPRSMGPDRRVRPRPGPARRRALA